MLASQLVIKFAGGHGTENPVVVFFLNKVLRFFKQVCFIVVLNFKKGESWKRFPLPEVIPAQNFLANILARGGVMEHV